MKTPLEIERAVLYMSRFVQPYRLKDAGRKLSCPKQTLREPRTKHPLRRHRPLGNIALTSSVYYIFEQFSRRAEIIFEIATLSFLYDKF